MGGSVGERSRLASVCKETKESILLASIRFCEGAGLLLFTTKARRHEGGLLDFESESRELIGAAIEVHRAIGPGLLESVYVRCLAMELKERGLEVRKEVKVPLYYRGVAVGPAYRLDLLVANKLIVEVKSVQRLEPVHRAQFLTYLRLTGNNGGFLLNFNHAVMREGIARMML